MNGFIRGPLTAAATLAATLTLGMGGIAFADTTEPRDCETVNTELVAAQADLQLPVTVQGVTYTSVESVQQVSNALPETIQLDPALQTVLDLNAKIGLLKTEKEVCTTPGDEPTPTEEPTPPDTDEPEQPEGLTVDQARARIAAFTCVGGVSEAFGRLQDEYLAVANELSVDLSSADRGKVSDAYFAKLDELNYCFPTGTTPTPDVVDQAGDTVNVGGSSSNSQFESTPSIAPETGLL